MSGTDSAAAHSARRVLAVLTSSRHVRWNVLGAIAATSWSYLDAAHFAQNSTREREKGERQRAKGSGCFGHGETGGEKEVAGVVLTQKRRMLTTALARGGSRTVVE